MLVKRDQRDLFCRFSLSSVHIQKQKELPLERGRWWVRRWGDRAMLEELLTAFTFPHKELAHLDLVGRICLKHKYGRLIFLLNQNKHMPVKHL